VTGIVQNAKTTISQTRRSAIVLGVKSPNQEVGAEEGILVEAEEGILVEAGVLVTQI